MNIYEMALFDKNNFDPNYSMNYSVNELGL